ncbi:hypothetical protein LCGC14_1000130 [marine sediment metagenome]|uniref:Phage head-tail adaptor n=1 Tax=marine sediment metagenome TaxID=412755 RepID=A0A0F9R9E5_9ZZZZ
MRSGQLNNRITIQADTGTKNSVGQKIESWGTLATVWGRVRSLTGSERFAAQQLVVELSYEITIRFRTDINETHRIVLTDGQTLDIQSAFDPDGRRRELKILCKERS